MASFFPPGVNNQRLLECTPGSYDVYCNSILPSDRRLASWYQAVSLAVGAAAMVVPVALFILYRLLSSSTRARTKVPGKTTSRRSWKPSRKHTRSLASVGSSASFKMSSLRSATSLQVKGACDLAVFPLEMSSNGDISPAAHSRQSLVSCFSHTVSEQTRRGSVDTGTLGGNGLGNDTLAATVDGLVDLYTRFDLAGFAVRFSSTTEPTQVDSLLEALNERRISCILVCHHDCEVLDRLSFARASGLILENACILDNGERRGYFQARRLRDVMVRCARARDHCTAGNDFFVGFWDEWQQRPHPSVVKRAVKLAEHFGAVLQHGPRQIAALGGLQRSPAAASKTISGFEYLRRAEIVELQKSWSSEDRAVVFSHDVDDPLSASDTVSRLPLGDLERLVFGATAIFEGKEIPAHLIATLQDPTQMATSPSYPDTFFLSSEADLWNAELNGSPLSAKGCFPIRSEPHIGHYSAIVDSQAHLRELDMLQAIRGAEEQSILAALVSLAHDQDCDIHVHDLINGLRTRGVRAYKGLHTGFRMPEGDAEFWGVCNVRDESDPGGIDIFVSQNSPNDAAVILHTWLAHHHMTRLERFEHEVLLENVTGLRHVSGLPSTIRTALDSATPAELLLLLQKIRLSQSNHRLTNAMGQYARSILIERTTQSNWKSLCARTSLDGTMPMEHLLRVRLEEHARRGAKRLPLLEDLVVFHDRMEEAIVDALYYGSHSILSKFTQPLIHCYSGTCSPGGSSQQVDVAADFYALIFFTILRRAAFEDVYLESTDRCPLFLSQPDQAAVFSELWTLGSQCESYFGLVPPDIGEIIYHRYNQSLKSLGAPTLHDREHNEIMTMYASTDTAPKPSRKAVLNMLAASPSSARLAPDTWVHVWKRRFAAASAMSIFCMPAVADIFLLTFLGRGLFMTGFMDPRHVQVSVYAILASLLLTAGVTGWVGSGASYYLPHYAYSNMIHFHVQRLSGGFVIAAIVSILGFIGFTVNLSVTSGLVFAAYMLGVSTYLNLLGVMSTMHQHGNPLPSGRIVFLQSFFLLLLSPLLSTFVNGYDLAIYLSVLYTFLVLVLYRYRRLCHRWSNWMSNIPAFHQADILRWHTSQMSSVSSSDSDNATCNTEKRQSDVSLEAQNAFRAAIATYRPRRHGRNFFISTTVPSKDELLNDDLVSKVAKGLPYIDWLLQKSGGGSNIPEIFSPAWFNKVEDAIHQQRQLSRGLKDNNALVLFRHARYDIGQNLGLFLVALLDRWIMLSMGARKPYPSIYTDTRSRYGFCFCLCYFCFASVVLDATLYQYWPVRDALSADKLRDLEDAKQVAAQVESKRQTALGKALVDVFSKVLIVFGAMTTLLWLFIDTKETIIMYYGYSFGYTCAILFQFNRCFTTNVAVHVRIILSSAVIGFVGGCIAHALPWSAGFLYTDMLAQNFAAALAAVGTTLWSYKDWSSSPSALSSPSRDTGTPDEHTVYIQRKVLVTPTVVDSPRCKNNLPKAFTVPTVISWDGTDIANRVTALLCLGPGQDLRGTVSGWPAQVGDAALRMWVTGQVKAAVLSRQHFLEAGFADAASLSFKNDETTLHVAVCFSGQPPIGGPLHHSPKIQLPYIIAEALLYHVAHVQLGLSEEQAVYSEHMIPGNDCISKRLEDEYTFAGPDANLLALSSRRFRMDFTTQLCLGIDINTQWHSLPQPVREVIISRIEDQPTRLSNEYIAWASQAQVDLATVDFHAKLALELHKRSIEQYSRVVYLDPGQSSVYEPPPLLRPVAITRGRESRGIVENIWHAVARIPFLVVKWIAIIAGGSSNVERELSYLLDGVYLRRPLLYLIMAVWKASWIIRNFWIYCFLVLQRPSIAHITRLAAKGARRKIYKNRIVVELKRSSVTGFAFVDDHNALVLQVFPGTPTTVPDKSEPLSVATYDSHCRLTRRLEAGGRISTYNYDPAKSSRRPISRELIHDGFHSVGSYDKHGRIVHGTMTIDNVALGFRYHYKLSSKGSSKVLRAHYRVAGTDDTLCVFWGKPVDIEDYTWVPSHNVGLIIRRIAGRTYTTTYDWSHRRDPIVTTFLEQANGQRTVLTHAPTLLANEKPLLDWPTNQALDMDDLLIYHSPLQIRQMRRYANVDKVPGLFAILDPSGWVARLNRCTYSQVPTSRIRTELWSRWLKGNDIDAVTACFVDEIILREEPLLRGYWRARDWGQLDEAVRALDSNISQIVAAIDIETDVSEVTLLAIRTSDLYAMGLSTDANAVTARPQDCYNDTHNRVSIIFNDVGCWPISPGGVSNCRRDLVNGHSTIRNHVLAECANDYGIPRFQVEKGVQSIKLLPLWGLNGGTANHGLHDNLLQSQVDEKIDDTDLQRDVVDTFIPLLNQFVKGCRTKRYTYADLVSLSNVFLSMAKYYEHKDYTRTWRSQEVEQAWVAAWLKPYNDPNIVDPTECFDIARPSLIDFRESLYVYLAYFFIFAVGVPEHCPRVFQSTHHGISSLFGMVLKYRRGVTFGIWDHAILWRECCLNFSVAQCELPVAVQSMVLAGIGLATHLAYFHADVILPCASVFNPMWEVELGTDGSRVGDRNHFRRKIDPVVNGISNMDAYKPVDKVRTDVPTVVMLSNVQFIKGIKFAIQAADIIINQFGFTDYRLVIYGAKDRQPEYAVQMEKLIVEKNLGAHVTLAGFGNSKKVLKDAWLFMNSSISEGLPLAIGEAALAGVPIVATEVGATALVLTDPEQDTQRYGEVVPPNDPMALARAQISMLSMVGPWAKFTTDPHAGPSSLAVAAHPVLPNDIKPEDVGWLTERFYEYSSDRRRLGLLSREVVLHSFHGARYIREHEQMYWVQWQLGKRRADPTLRPLPFKFGAAEPLRYHEDGGA